MPAVQLLRLKVQVDELVWKFTRPAEFVRGLNDVLDGYAEHAYRPGQNVAGRSLIPSYRTPALVMKHIQQQVIRPLGENPTAGLALADALWQDEYLEVRLLGVFLLGLAPLEPLQPVLGRLLAWARPTEDRTIQQALFSQGCAGLRRSLPERWLEIIQEWLVTQEVSTRRMGLRALAALAAEGEFENLPALFAMLSPMTPVASGEVQVELEQALLALAKRSPVETGFFLRQVVSGAARQEAVQLIRRLVPAFPPEQQESLREALRGRGL
jgi:hypothetical protein